MTREKKTISLCMIVYNEESNLPLCLESVRQIVDEIIIVDTGSTDHTLAIAQQAGACLYSFLWQDDFAQARNFSLGQAKREWILVLDADEVLDPCYLWQFQELMNNHDIEGYFFPIKNVVHENNHETLDFVVRFFRNRPEYQFEGALHEQILPSMLRSVGPSALAHAPLSITHFGYLAQAITIKNKFERNRQILSKELQQDPANGFYLYCLGLEYLQQNELTSGISYLKAALAQVSHDAGYYPDLLLNLALSYLKTGQISQLFAILNQGLEISERPRDYFILYGIGHLMTREPLKAINPLNQALQIQNTYSEIFSNSQIYALLGDSYAQAKLHESAIEAYLDALKDSPQHLYPFLQILHLLREMFSFEELIANPNLLNRLSSFASPDYLLNMATNLKEQNDLFLSTLLKLCALISYLDSPTKKLPDVPLLYQDIKNVLNTLDLNTVPPQLAQALLLMLYEWEIVSQFIQHFPDEQIVLTQFSRIFYRLFSLITFYYLPPLVPSQDIIPHVSFLR